MAASEAREQREHRSSSVPRRMAEDEGTSWLAKLTATGPRKRSRQWPAEERFRGMTSGDRWVGKKQALGPPTWARAVLGRAIGAPSAGLSLDGWLASRA